MTGPAATGDDREEMVCPDCGTPGWRGRWNCQLHLPVDELTKEISFDHCRAFDELEPSRSFGFPARKLVFLTFSLPDAP